MTIAPDIAPLKLSLLARAVAIADAARHGRHLSASRGSSTEFFDYRPYAPGDPARLIDARLQARSDRLFVRRFRHEGPLSILLIVDASASMNFASIDDDAPAARRAARATKLRLACDVAAAIAVSVAREGDRVGLLVAREEGAAAGPSRSAPDDARAAQPLEVPASGWPAAGRVIEALSALESALPAPRGTPSPGPGATSPLAAALARASVLLRRGGVAMVLSDWLDEPAPVLAAASSFRWRGASGGGMGQVSARRLVVGVEVLARDELRAEHLPAARLLDPEHPGLALDHEPNAGAEAAVKAIDDHRRSLRSGLAALGIPLVSALADEPAAWVLRRVASASI